MDQRTYSLFLCRVAGEIEKSYLKRSTARDARMFI